MSRLTGRSFLLAALLAGCTQTGGHESQVAPTAGVDTASWLSAPVVTTGAALGRNMAAADAKVLAEQARGSRFAAVPRAEEADELIVVQHAARADVSDGVTQGSLRARDTTGKVVGEFPLQRTEVNVEIGGFLARTVLDQTYVNSFERAIEAVYVFPMPSLAAVHDFEMEIGSRRIVGVVRRREEAERIYQEARARGQTASLLTQERPNIFTQSVANIDPGGTVRIRITYFERLSYENGEYAYVFPMVVGPRYVSGTPQVAQGETLVSGGGGRRGGGGWSVATDRVPDADRITPPV
ncbi:MAG TPA: VIT domain-containing protein, partial [Gemmatimonadaceae bacterium]|nr:VIT domain-containing protein [Gemmatimonadaceae bacterium]